MTDNTEDFNKGIEKLIEKLKVATTDTVRDLSELAVLDAQNTTAFNNKLKQSTQFKMNGSFASEVFDSRDYAYYLEYGNDPGGGTIYPVRAKALHFFINGEEIFAKSVKAHGPYHFVEHGRDMAAQNIETIFNRNFK